MIEIKPEKAIQLLKSDKVRVINNTKSIMKKLKKRKKVTVVISAYNAENDIGKCIDSVINQTFPFEQIELIIIDDCSIDNTQSILVKYAEQFSNITVVLFSENSGTAGLPRNVGIELATTDKIMFLDSDDWLDVNAILKLVTTMEENEDDFVVGKTVKVTDSGESVHAEFVSYKSRNHVSPFEIPYIFYHMGPPAKLIKTSVIKDNMIRFPEMKFGEDKFFLFNVLLHCKYVSTITDPIYYVNRLSKNNQSLTQVTNVLDKRSADMGILKYMANMQLPTEIEQVYMKRLVEYDLVKTCDSFVFVRSKDKQKFLNYIREALNILKDRPYNLIDTFDTPLYKVAAKLILENRDEDFIELFNWYKFEKNKRIFIKNGIAYYRVDPFADSDPYKYIPISLFVRAKDSYVEDGQYVQTIEVYGEKLNTVENVLIRDRNNLDNELKLPITITDNHGEFRVNYNQLNHLQNSLFTVFIRYDGHRLANIKRNEDIDVTYENREFKFYTTKAGNLGFSIKNI